MYTVALRLFHSAFRASFSLASACLADAALGIVPRVGMRSWEGQLEHRHVQTKPHN